MKPVTYYLNKKFKNLKNKVFLKETDSVIFVLFVISKIETQLKLGEKKDPALWEDFFMSAFETLWKIYIKNKGDFDKLKSFYEVKFSILKTLRKSNFQMKDCQYFLLKRYDYYKEKCHYDDSKIALLLGKKKVKSLLTLVKSIRLMDLEWKDYIDKNQSHKVMSYEYRLARYYLENLISKLKKTHPKRAVFMHYYFIEEQELPQIKVLMEFKKMKTLTNLKYKTFKMLKQHFNRGVNLENI